MDIENKISLFNQKLDQREKLKTMLQRYKASHNRGDWYYESEVLDFIMGNLI